MLWRTHFLAGAATGVMIAGNADPKTIAISMGIAGISALLPDLDDPNSKLGRLVPIASWMIKKIVGHRGPLHSLLGAGAAFLLASVLLRISGHAHLAAPIVAGYISHLVMDSLNPQGVPWLWPVKTHFKIPIAQTGSFIEKLVVTPVLLVLCMILAVSV
jgi:inner membrane protein